MSALMRLHRPSELSAEHLGVHVEATEAGGMADGGLSDFQHCAAKKPERPAGTTGWAKADLSAVEPVQVPLLEPETACPLYPQPAHAHTHLWIGGKGVCISEKRGRVAVAVPIDPTTGLPVPGETP